MGPQIAGAGGRLGVVAKASQPSRGQLAQALVVVDDQDANDPERG